LNLYNIEDNRFKIFIKNMSEKEKQIINIIKDLNKNIIFIDKKLAQLFNFMIIDNQKKLDIELTITFFNNIYNDYILSMTVMHDIDIKGCDSANTITHGFLKSYTEKINLISSILNNFNNIILAEKNNLVDYDHIDKSHVTKIIQINEKFIINYIDKICDEEAEKLFSLKLYFTEKLDYYKNFKKLDLEQLANKPNRESSKYVQDQLFFHFVSSVIIVIFVFTIKNIGMLIYNNISITELSNN
jgi:hypothetical protein